MKPTRPELVLLAEQFEALRLIWRYTPIRARAVTLEALTVTLENVFDETDIEVRLMPVDQVDVESDDALLDEDESPLVLLRLDATLPVLFSDERLGALLTCLDIINEAMPFGAFCLHAEHRIAFHYTYAARITVFDTSLVLHLLRSLEYYLALAAQPLKLALRSQQSPDQIRAEVVAFLEQLHAATER
jgi:hypothetical protein